MTKKEWSFDLNCFALLVVGCRQALELTMRDAAENAGVSASCISRAENCQTISSASFLALCFWMGANPYWFLTDPKTGNKVANPPGAEPDARAA